MVTATPSPAVRPWWRWRQWMGAVLIVAYIVLISVMSFVVHPRVALALFGSGLLSPEQVFMVVVGVAGLAAVAWYSVFTTWVAGATASRARLWVAIVISLGCTVLVSPPGRVGTEHWRERLTDNLGWVLGRTEAVAGSTVLFAFLPTLLLVGALWWWTRTGGRVRKPVAYVGLVGWLVAVAELGWFLGRL